MKTKIKRHSRSVIAVVLTLCMLVSCMTVGLIATDAAKVTDSSKAGAFVGDEAVAYDGTSYVKGEWDNWATPDENKGHNITDNGYTVYLQANKTYKFVFVASNGDVFKKDQTISGTVSSYDFPHDATNDAKIRTTIAGNYTFQFQDWTSSSLRANITFPEDNTPETWTAVGAYGTESNSEAGFFGSPWSVTATANDLTKDGTTWSKTWNNVKLDSQQTVYYKVAKNHSWDTAYPPQNASETLDAGTYNITITYDPSTNAVNLTATSVAKSTLTVASNDNATVTATYNGTTVGEGQSIQDVPQGATVSVTVIPASGKQCTAVTGTYDTNSTVAGTGAGQSWSLVMPGADTTVSVTLGNVTMKKIYFNNNYTQYGTVYAYVYDKDGTDHTYEYLGAKPGKVMIEPANSEIWYIEVPNDVDYVEFISGDGKTTGEMKIPWPNSGESQTYTYPKYTAPYNYDAPTIANGGTWGNYIWGSTNKRSNEYTVSDGTTMSNPNLFTGITATMYDYYTDGEITASAGTATDNGDDGAPKGWIKGINNNEYTWSEFDNSRVPYKTLNAALSAYADAAKTRDNTDWSNPSEPKYGVTYPLYFGDLLTSDDAVSQHVATLYNWHYGANNSNGLSASNKAATGLSGNQLGDDKTIHYYKSGATNENGAPMAMFNEDFLSGENIHNKPLATILRTSTFPVRKEENVGGTTTYENKIYVEANRWAEADAKIWAHFWGDNGDTGNRQLTKVGDYYVCDIPSESKKVELVRMSNDSTAIYQDDDKTWAKSDNLTVPTSNTSAARLYTHTGTGNNDWNAFSTGNLDKSYGTTTGGHTYYEFDSEHGKDNAYIETINKSDKTAVINYYNNENKVKSAKGTEGFFPFNRNDYVPNQTALNYAQDLGFGMKLTIPFTLEGSGADNGINTDGTDQEFRFSGDDDLWVFVDDKLVLDLGGAHGRTEGSINFHTKTVTANDVEAIPDGITDGTNRNGSFATGFNTNPNYVHTMTIYYMERGMIDSNLRFGFSFHAIPNQFWIDKKIRTKDKDNLGYDTINAGFFNNNNQDGDASNMTTYAVGGKTTTMSKFERSFQNEKFMVTHWYGNSTADTLATGKHYTIDNDTTTYTVGSDGKYPIYHDLGNAFIGEFTTGKKFKLKEEPDGSNKYVYQPVFSVWDQANNDKKIQHNGDNNNGYTFTFNPTTSVSGGIENTNIKARFENYMVAHNLTLTKELTNTTDPESIFTFKILFDFSTSDTANYVSFPLYCFVDGVRTKLTDTGTITVKAGQVVVIDEIPEKAKVQVTEVLTDTVSGYRYAGMTLKKGSTVLTKDTEYTEVTKGIQFQMGDGDMSAVISNKKPDNKYTIKYKYAPYVQKYSTQSYTISGVFTESELKTYLQLNETTGALEFKSDDLKKTFISGKAPYEDNFQQTLSFANPVITEEGTGWVNGNYSCDAEAVPDSNNKINVYFNLPYAVDSDTSLVPQPKEGTNKVEKLNTPVAKGAKEIDCFDWYVTAGKSHKNNTGTSPVYVKAPLIVYTNVEDNATAKYFQYWQVSTQGKYGTSPTPYTRCYDYEFNFALFMDCIIEPIYADTWAQSTGNLNPPTTYNMYTRYDAELQITSDLSKGINIAFLENSRNQYNKDGNGGRQTSPHAADVVYSDFLLNFNYVDGLTQLNKLNEGTKKAGIVVEAVNYMQYEKDDNDESTTIFDNNKDYSSDVNYNGNVDTKKNQIVTWLTNGGTRPDGIAKSQFDVKKLDNKNCIQYYYSFNNRSYSEENGGQLVNDLQNRYKVFRAYAYIGDTVQNDASKLQNVQISAPVYFTIYDVGSQLLDDNVIKP